MTYALEVEGLCRRETSGEASLQNFHIALPQGFALGLWGQTGAGKTTALHCIMNLLRRDSGQVRFFDVSDASAALREQVAFLSPEACFPEYLTARQLADVFSNLYRSWDAQTFRQLLDRFQVPWNKKIHAIRSTNTPAWLYERKCRIALAIALSHDTKLLIWDNFLSGLNTETEQLMLDVLCEFMEHPHHSMLFATESVAVLDRLADYIGVLEQGQLVLSERIDRLCYEYGIAKLSPEAFALLTPKDYIKAQTDRQHYRLLVPNRTQFAKEHPEARLSMPTPKQIIAFWKEGGMV